jgi:hypothetical protein
MFDLASVKEAAEAAGMASQQHSGFHIDLSDGTALCLSGEEPRCLAAAVICEPRSLCGGEYFD